jgi:hypothetical protein
MSAFSSRHITLEKLIKFIKEKGSHEVPCKVRLRGYLYLSVTFLVVVVVVVVVVVAAAAEL